MNKKTTFFIACFLLSIFIKAQVAKPISSSDLLNEKKITQILDNARKNGIQDNEISMQKKYLHQKLKQQNEAIANGTFGQKIIQPQPQINSNICFNPGFENGTTNGWALYSGNINAVNLPCNTCATTGYPYPISHVVNSTSTISGQCHNGVDIHGGFPVVAPGSNGGSYSLLLNDTTAGGKMQKAQYGFVVPAANNNYFTYQYAIVLQNGYHPINNQAYFSVEVVNVTTNSVIPCSSYLQSVPNDGLPLAGWLQSTNDTYVKPWTSISLDLSPYVGDSLAINFVVSDCDQGAHYGYVYIDAACNTSAPIISGQITASNRLCIGGTTTLSGPYGLGSYSWTGPVTGNSANLLTNVAGTYTLSCTSATGCNPIPDMYYTLSQTTDTVPTVSIHNLNSDTMCANTTTTLTAGGVNTYTWSNNQTTSSIAITPTVTTTYTLTGTDTSNGCVNSATKLITVKPNVNVIVYTSNTSPCVGASITLTASGANTYTWSNSATTNTITIIATTNLSYSVTGTDTTSGCSHTTVYNVPIIPNVTVTNSNDSMCGGGGSNSILSASGASTYTWSTGQVSPSISVSPTTTTIYTVYPSGTCTRAITTTVTILPLPNVTISSSLQCVGSMITLVANGANTYHWITGDTTSSTLVPSSVSSYYYVVGIDTYSCQSTATFSVTGAINVAPTICEVTTSDSTNYAYNYVIWDKTPYTNVDSFIVYRYDVVSASYLQIGSVSKTALSQFIDTAFSIGGPNGGNPIYASWQYKLAIKDTCGNIGTLSPYHQTMYVQQISGNFSWNAYTFESGQTVTGYALLRDDNNTGIWHVLVHTTGLSVTDPNYSSYPNGNWRVEAYGFNCLPTLKLASNNNSTQSSYRNASSNTIKPLAITGINKISVNNLDVTLYPNPTKNILNVVCKVKNTKLYITDMLGKRVIQVNAENELTTIDVSQLSNGIYFLNTNTTNGLITKKFVVQQ